MKEMETLDKIIYGRIKPHVYAFSTNTIPNYLKIGDTYRPLSIRMNEWRIHYPDLIQKYDHEAMINEDVFFRDHAIHKYLETELGKHRLEPNELKSNLYYSNEFFKDTNTNEIEKALEDIKNDFDNKTGKYNFYDANSQLSIRTVYARDEDWKPRPNQKIVIDNFWKAYHDNHRTNLLMYAVMRFGKSFTALCCAKKMDAKVVVIVSAKADVKEEWKKNVEKPYIFEGYEFLSSDDLLYNNHVIKDKLDAEIKVVIFLTLQDLQGENIKEKHKELFKTDIDMLLVDETHFGARAEKYGAVLRDQLHEINDEDSIDIETANELIKKQLSAEVCIHLSGTPYRILMNGEFEKDDIIAFCQFSDIVDAKEKWDYENNLKSNPQEEWENPYYGFPQMIRFAFAPSVKTRIRIGRLKEAGLSASFSDIFRPKSIKVDSEGNYKKFIFEDEVLDLLEIIDGSKEDENILSILDYNKIKEGKMCQHIVCVLPYCSSCDALEELINNNKNKFKNLSQYEIINISGGGTSNRYSNTESIKNKIHMCSKNGIKTITLTVNRMLTGSTVEEWDTMIYLKDTSSPQEYDQSIFRLQNQFIKKYISDDGDVIKYNNKPQTLLVDFSPNRMYFMQEEKSKIYNVNVDRAGNKKLQNRIERELEISPIISVNRNKIVQIEATDIMGAVSHYSKSRGVVDETNEIPVDFKLLDIDDIKNEIDIQAEIGTKNGLSIYNTEEKEDSDLLVEDTDENVTHEDETVSQEQELDDEEKVIVRFERKFRTYYARILFYSFLTKSRVNSLEDIINTISEGDNVRIAKNLFINPRILKLIYSNMNPFIISKLDYKIQNINNLSNDETLEEITRARVAINKFNKLSDSEIVTPQEMCKKIVDMLPCEKLINELNNDRKILDVASKQGEFAVAFVEKLRDKIDDRILKNSICSIPTSSAAYEFTRKIYEILGMNIKNIATTFNSYSMLKVLKNNQIDYVAIADFLNQNKEFSDIYLENNLLYQEGGNNVKFSVVVGNPPYQEGRKTIFHHFQLIADYMKPDYSVLIYPGKRWIHRSGKGMESFGYNLINDNNLAKLIYYPNSRDIFDCVDVTDGISVVFKDYNNVYDRINYEYINGKEEPIVVQYDKPGDNLIPLCPLDRTIVEKISKFKNKENLDYISSTVSEQKFFGIESNFVELNISKVKPYTKDYELKENEIRILTNDKSGSQGRSKWFVVDESLINKNTDSIHKWKVVVSSAHPGGQDGRDNQLEVLDDRSVFGRARVSLKMFTTKKEAENFYKFFTSNIIKFSLLLTDENLASFGRQTIDILNYKDDNKYIDFTKDIDQQLIRLLGLTEDEYKYILKVVS